MITSGSWSPGERPPRWSCHHKTWPLPGTPRGAGRQQERLAVTSVSSLPLMSCQCLPLAKPDQSQTEREGGLDYSPYELASKTKGSVAEAGAWRALSPAQAP